MPSTTIRLFLIDDNHFEHENFERVLKKLDIGCECIGCYSGEKALCHLNDPGKELPHLIFVDIKMPGMNGIEFLMQLKLSDHLSDIPVYIYSGVDDYSYIERALQLGVAGHIIKSANNQELNAGLNEAFNTLLGRQS